MTTVTDKTTNKKQSTLFYSVPKYPLILIYATDWNLYRDICKENYDFKIAKCWIAGWLISEDQEQLVVAFESFVETQDNQVRDVTVIPKKNIIFKRVVKDFSILKI